MSTRTGLVSAVLLAAVCGVASSQPPGSPSRPTPVFPPPGTVPLPAPHVVAPTSPPASTPPPPSTVEQLLNELERVQTQKTELENKEKELKVAIAKKLEAQAERLKKLGVATPVKEKEPDRVGKIIIEGNAKTPDKKILALVELQPGQILPYPALETARARLEKAGFRNATVEAIPNELDSHFKDVRVRVIEADGR